MLKKLLMIALMAMSLPTFAKTAAITPHQKIDRFVDHMVEEYQFDREDLRDFLLGIEPEPKVFKLFQKRHKGVHTQEELEYFATLSKQRIQNGILFWEKYEDALLRVQEVYSIPGDVIVGLIGIETAYGSYLGKFKAHQVLVTLAFYGKHRPKYFEHQLEHFLVLADEQGWERDNVLSSYAGALGIPQFMPDNVEQYAVDWNRDGKIDLMDPVDAIGSVANFLYEHGWVQDAPIASQTNKFIRKKTFYSWQFGQSKRTIWMKRENFYTLRRYNPLDSYAMAIFVLSEKVREIREVTPQFTVSDDDSTINMLHELF